MRHFTVTTKVAVLVIVSSALYWLTRLSALLRSDSRQLATVPHLVNTYAQGREVEGEKQGQKETGQSELTAVATPYAALRQGYPARFPRRIWQTSNQEGREKWAEQIKTWTSIRGYEYTFISDETADEFVHTRFNHRPAISAFWDQLQLKVIRADLLRYLIMLAEGGIYSDIDTSALRHPDLWIPADQGAHVINAIVGLEYDDTTYPLFVRPISWCQWTLMSKPNHPIFELAVQRVMSNLEYIARRQHQDISTIHLKMKDVLAATGPGLITDVVIQVLRDQGQNVTWATFHNMTEAKLFGDVLVLPINAFAGHQKHSHAGDPAYGPHYVQHHFARSWYTRPADSTQLVDEDRFANMG